ncbi:CAP domain-containing protein [Pseudomonas sp. SMSB3]|uniref:CAP domain-containing protein n=1 Tax=unclassified Pseudomonas TaxID=196821 RepID=UPI0011AA96E7|nr:MULTISPECIES: CAP domain-containing protein [unclassified Pseudomonas]
MRVLSSVAALSLGLVFSTAALAVTGEEARLIDSINSYRSQAQACGSGASLELPPLNSDTRLALSPEGTRDLQQAMSRAAYPMVNVQAISLSGPRDAPAAMHAIEESFCQVVLDPQFVDIGVSQEGRDWRIVLARPLLSGRLGDWQAEGQKLLQAINTARSAPHQCGGQPFAAAPALTWSSVLAGVAAEHTRAMANQNFFDHIDKEGRTPGDRAELAGYLYQQIGENIAAGRDSAQKVVEGWLDSPGHCATLMNPDFKELGAAYAVDPKSDAGIYWTSLFGTAQ